ncbi:Glu/Leu/Phe/Val dehydrogenase dimerization domain-containing protein [Marinobacteraceae bacterium S3BR75-40.1]
MLDRLEREGMEAVHCRFDPVSGLKSYIAIHNTHRGPALGGCRFIHYDSDEEALNDAIRLARGMSYKAALADVPQGGGKAVIMRPPGDFDAAALFRAFGDFVDSLGGRYITAIDAGTSAQEMDWVAERTRFVTSTSRAGNPSPFTARGVLAGIRAAVAHRFGSEDLSGVHVAIQGVGHVGAPLAEALAEAGAMLTLSDIDPHQLDRVATRTNAHVVAPEAIHSVACEVFSPCGLGGIINERTRGQLRCAIVAGSANNQLQRPEDGVALYKSNILYAPDYVINAGGLIYASLHYHGEATETIERRCDAIGSTLETLFQRAEREGQPPSETADHLAREILEGHHD